MEIKLSNVTTKKIENINILLPENNITAMIGPNDSDVKEILDLISGNKKISDGSIKYGTKEITKNSSKQDLIEVKNDIFYLTDDNEYLFNINILEDIKYYIKNLNIDRFKELLKAFGLNYNICEKSYFELSYSETKKILLIIAIMSSATTVIIENITEGFDFKSQQALIKQLKKIKRENKVIIITSNDSDFLLESSDNVIAISDKKVIKSGIKYEIFSDEKILSKINFDMPHILKFIKTSKEIKNIKLGYRDNINDLIKDIYRNAK